MAGGLVLTAYIRRLLEGLSNLRIHVDQQIFLSSDLPVALLDLPLDPLAEVLADDGVADVDDPLLGQLRQLLVDWEELEHLRILLEELEDVLHGQSIILWDMQVCNILGLNDYSENG